MSDGANAVALLRAVNVGGRKLLMADLRAAAARLGWADVATYIASGNLLFRADGAQEARAAALEKALAQDCGMKVEVLVLNAGQVAVALGDCPFAAAPGNLVHGFFCWQEPEVDAAALAALARPDEALEQRGRVVWLHAPSGIGRSDLAAKIGRVITRTQLTARNLNTVRALHARLGSP